MQIEELVKELNVYAKYNYNVLLVGHHGIGKTSLIRKVFEEQGLKWKYFNGPTMDPWINFIGVPREVDGHLDFILPSDFSDDSVEAIFIDEPNRAHTAVRNAILELIQFKSMNGRKFNNLKMVWAAINPDSDDSYDVERLDPALRDRFEVTIEVPLQVNVEFFKSEYGDIGVRACEFWQSLDAKQKCDFSPRRLEYALRLNRDVNNPRAAIPKTVNAADFVRTLYKGSFYERFMDASDTEKTNIVNTDTESVLKMWAGRPEIATQHAHRLNNERLTAIINDNDDKLSIILGDFPEHVKGPSDRHTERSSPYDKLMVNIHGLDTETSNKFNENIHNIKQIPTYDDYIRRHYYDNSIANIVAKKTVKNLPNPHEEIKEFVKIVEEDVNNTKGIYSAFDRLVSDDHVTVFTEVDGLIKISDTIVHAMGVCMLQQYLNHVVQLLIANFPDKTELSNFLKSEERRKLFACLYIFKNLKYLNLE